MLLLTVLVNYRKYEVRNVIYCFFHFIVFLSTGERRDRELKEGLHEDVFCQFCKKSYS